MGTLASTFPPPYCTRHGALPATQMRAPFFPSQSAAPSPLRLNQRTYCVAVRATPFYFGWLREALTSTDITATAANSHGPSVTVALLPFSSFTASYPRLTRVAEATAAATT